jgi:hypothetical protein
MDCRTSVTGNSNNAVGSVLWSWVLKRDYKVAKKFKNRKYDKKKKKEHYHNAKPSRLRLNSAKFAAHYS